MENAAANTRKILDAAVLGAVRRGQAAVGPEHLLLALLGREDTVAYAVLRNRAVDIEGLRGDLESELAKYPQSLAGRTLWTPEGAAVQESAAREARAAGRQLVGTEHLLIALSSAAGPAGELLRTHGGEPELLRREVDKQVERFRVREPAPRPVGPPPMPVLRPAAGGQPVRVGRRGRLIIGGIVGLAVIVVGAQLVFLANRGGTSGVEGEVWRPGTILVSEVRNLYPNDAQRRRILPVVRAPRRGTFAFAQHQDDSRVPVTWDPCIPIHVESHGAETFPGADKLLRRALAEVEQASGLKLIFDGASDRTVKFGEKILEDNLWQPVTVAWSTPEVTPELAGDVAAVAGGATVKLGARRWYVAGEVALDTPEFARIRSDFGDGAVRAMLMREFGLVLGLDLGDSSRELMTATPSGKQTEWGPGDRYALAQLGAGPCIDPTHL